MLAMVSTSFSQTEQVIGRSMVLKTSGHPDSIASLSNPPVNFGNAVVLDTVSGSLFVFNYADSTWNEQVSKTHSTYVAKVVQSGTGTPTVTEIYNDLPVDIVFSVGTSGPNYSVVGTFSSDIDSDKVFLSVTYQAPSAFIDRYVTSNIFNTAFRYAIQDISDGIAIDGTTCYVKLTIYN